MKNSIKNTKMTAYEINTAEDFFQMIVEREIPPSDIKLLLINLSRSERYKLFGTRNINLIMSRIPELLRTYQALLPKDKDKEGVIPKEQLLDGIGIIERNLKRCKEHINDYYEDLQIYRERSETKKDLDILFDYIDENLYTKDFWEIQVDFDKKYYFILISMLHKKTDGLLQKIDEIRPLFHDFDEKMTRLLKQNHLWFTEQHYINKSETSKNCILSLDNFVECINNGYKIE